MLRLLKGTAMSLRFYKQLSRSVALPSVFKFSALYAGLFTGLLLPHAHAQAADALVSDVKASDMEAPNVKEKSTLEVIEVTSQKRVENIQEVPISVATFTAERMEKIGLRELKEVAEFIPNFSMTTTNDFSSTIKMRGVGAPSQNIGFDARVGLYLDGVYLGQSAALNQELLDLERIEVLRGPQGTLFGKNNIAGAVSLISEKPSEELSGYVSGSLGNYDYQQLNTVVNVPLTDNFMTKFSYNQQKRDGFTENIVTGNNLNEVDNYSYRGQFRYLPVENVDINFSVDRLVSERLSFDGEAITDTLGNNVNTEAPLQNQVSIGLDPWEEKDISGEILTAEWALGNDHIVKSISGHRDTTIQYNNDFDFSVEDISALEYLDDYDQWSQELQFISPVGDFEYIAGLYLYHLDAHTERISNVGDETLTLFTGIPREVIEYGASLGDPTAIGALYAFQPGELSTIGDVETQSYSAFVNTSYQFSEMFELAAGLRYSEETKKVDWTISSIDPNTNVPVIPAFELANGTVIDERTDNHFSPMISLNMTLNDELNAYAKYANAYKSGGYNVDFLTQAQLDAGLEYNKETVDSYELGFKGLLLDGKLRFSSALFFAQYDDYQVNQLVDLGSGTTAISIRNAAEVETKGAEIEATYQVAEHLSLLTSFGVLDGEFTQYPGGGNNGEDLSGTALPGVSDFTANLGAEYMYTLSSLAIDVTFAANYNYESGYNSNLTGETSIPVGDPALGATLDVGTVEAFGILNANISIEPHSVDGLNVYLWLRNALDDDTAIVHGEKGFFGTRRNVYVNPRTFGATVKYNF